MHQFKWYKSKFYTPKIFISPLLSTSEFVQTKYTLGEEIELNFIVCVQPFAVLIDILCGLLPVAPSHDALLVGVLFLVQSLFIWSSYENITFGFPKGWSEIKLVSIRPRNKLSKVSRTSDLVVLAFIRLPGAEEVPPVFMFDLANATSSRIWER